MINIINFSKYVERTDTCWFWCGGISKGGYGNFRVGYTQIGAHKASWIIVNGTVPENKYVLHRCDVRHCVNPDHLFLGTPLINMLDKINKGKGTEGSKNLMAMLTEEKVLEILQEAKSGQYSNTALGIKYNIHHSVIGKIIKGIAWKHIERVH